MILTEQKARTTYDNILRLVDDPDVRDPIKFLRAREIVHYQRFAEALGIAQERSGCKTNYYITNPSFDIGCTPACPEARNYGENTAAGNDRCSFSPEYRPYSRSANIDHKRAF